MRGEEGGQETDDQDCPPTSCTESSTALFSFVSPPHPRPPPHAALSTFLSAAYPSQSCGAILGAFYPNPVPRSTEPRTEDVREVRRGDRLNRHRGVDWSPSASCALHIPLVVAVGIPLFGVVSF